MGQQLQGLGGQGAPPARFVVPWRADGGHRERLWAFARGWWERQVPEVPIVEAPGPPGPFNRAAAINAAARGAWRVAVILDADVVADGGQVRAAIARAVQTGRMVLAFDAYYGFKPQVTEQVLGGHWAAWSTWAYRVRKPQHESSIVVVPRALWDRLGGFDERFVGWGQEDVAFCQAARVLGGGIERVPGPVYHLYHQRSAFKDKSLPSYQAAQALGARYRAATTPEAVAALLEEALH